MKKKMFFLLAILAAVIVLWLSITPIVDALICEEYFESCVAGCGVHPSDKCFRRCMIYYDNCDEG